MQGGGGTLFPFASLTLPSLLRNPRRTRTLQIVDAFDAFTMLYSLKKTDHKLLPFCLIFRFVRSPATHVLALGIRFFSVYYTNPQRIYLTQKKSGWQNYNVSFITNTDQYKCLHWPRLISYKTISSFSHGDILQTRQFYALPLPTKNTSY